MPRSDGLCAYTSLLYMLALAYISDSERSKT